LARSVWAYVGIAAPSGYGALLKSGQISRPSATVYYADSGDATSGTMSDTNADNWVQDTTSLQKSWIDWRSPFTPPNGAADPNWIGLPTRTLDRHSKRCVMGFVDYHAETLKASSVGFYETIGSTGDLWSGK